MNPLREHLLRSLTWEDAHRAFDAAVDGVPPELRGKQPNGLPWSCWQLVEHLRLTQRDILEFCVDPGYAEKEWPDDYWPPAAAPPTEHAWDERIASFRDDVEELKRLTENEEIDLFATIPHGTGQTYLRELLLIIDHNAYHVGQLVVVRRLLGIWR